MGTLWWGPPAPASLRRHTQVSLPGHCHGAVKCPCGRAGQQPLDRQLKETTCKQQARHPGPIGLPGAAVLPSTIEDRVGQSMPGRRLRRAAVAPPSPGAQGDVFAEEEADNRGKWAVLRTPNIVAHGACCCCPRQAEAAALSQPRLHVAGTLLFILVPWGGFGLPGDLWPLRRAGRNRRHLMARSHAGMRAPPHATMSVVMGTGASPPVAQLLVGTACEHWRQETHRRASPAMHPATAPTQS